MPISLHDAFLIPALQIVRATDGLLDKAMAFVADGKASEAELIDARLTADMAPFATQVKWVSSHSLGAIKSVQAGNFSPDLLPAPQTLADLQSLTRASIAELAVITVDDMAALEGKLTYFTFNDTKMPFDGEHFLMTFSHPNFYFHAVTAYDILRVKGVAIGKRDFMGMPRIKMGS
jgi:hypothetical protein